MLVGLDIMQTKEEDGGVLMVDFAKAFDSVEREVIYLILERLNFPQKFIQIIRASHTKTTTTFLVNGFTSKEVQVQRGIRQGCPLAPLLFILIIDFFYRICKTEIERPGFQINIENREHRLWSVGFADDMSLFFRNKKQLSEYLSKLQEFSYLTGLKIQEQKSLIIAPKYEVDKINGRPINKKRIIVRFLGIGIKEKMTNEEAWQWYLPKIIKRIHLMAQKTTTICQRIQAFQSIIHAMIRFQSNIYYPNKNIIYKLNQLQKNYIWGNFASILPKTKARLKAEFFHSSIKAGGMGCPEISKVLDKLAVNRIFRWNKKPTTLAGAMGRWLINNQTNEKMNIPAINTKLYIQPGICGANTNKISSNIFIKGIYLWDNLLKKEQNTKSANAITTQKSWYKSFDTLINQDGQCIFKISKLAAQNWNKYVMERKATMDINESFIPYYNIFQNPNILDLQGNQLTRNNYPYIIKEINCIQNLGLLIKRNDWTYLWHRTMKNNNNTEVQQYLHLMKIIIINVPMITRMNDINQLEVRNVPAEFRHSKFSITQEKQNIHVVTGISQKGKAFLFKINDKMEIRWSSNTEKKKGYIQPHPQLCRIITSYKKVIVTKKTSEYKILPLQSYVNNISIYKEINTETKEKLDIFWKKMERKPKKFKNNKSQEIENRFYDIFLYKFNTNQLAWWYKNKPQIRKCINCDKELETFQHLFRDCEIAQFLWYSWAKMLNISNAKKVWENEELMKPLKWGEIIIVHKNETNNLKPSDIIKIQKMIYQLGGKEILNMLWKIRNNKIHENVEIPSKQILWNNIRNILIQRTKLLEYGMNNKQRIYISNWLNQKEKKEKQNKNLFMLFDGGARGNPGISGCGAIVGEINNIKEITGGYYMEKTVFRIHGIITSFLGIQTNNFAEYEGLLTGLELIMENFEHQNNITIIGDSQMILETIKNVKFTNNFLQQQEQIYEILQYQEEINYYHHFRTENKTADLLANMAMNRKKNGITNKELRNEIVGKKSIIEDFVKKDVEQELGNIQVEWIENIKIIENSREERKKRD